MIGPGIEAQELLAAGWKRTRSLTMWEHPDGRFFRGPHGAWEVMKGLSAGTELKRYKIGSPEYAEYLRSQPPHERSQ